LDKIGGFKNKNIERIIINKYIILDKIGGFKNKKILFWIKLEGSKIKILRE